MTIKRVSHMTIHVRDQDAAKAFYTEKLGFEALEDGVFDGYRWITVAPKGQSDFSVILAPIKPFGTMTEESAQKMHEVVGSSALFCGVLQTEDCQAEYDALSTKGVEFVMPPTERPWGLEAVLKDNSGNCWSLVQSPSE